MLVTPYLNQSGLVPVRVNLCVDKLFAVLIFLLPAWLLEFLFEWC